MSETKAEIQAKMRDKIIEELVDSINISENGAFEGGEGTVHEYMDKFNLLKSELLQDEKFIKAMDSKRYYLPELYEDFSFNSSIYSIFVQMKKDNSRSFKVFMKMLYKKMGEIIKTSKVGKFELYYPINIEKLTEKIDKIVIRDITIELLEYNEIDIFNRDLTIEILGYNELDIFNNGKIKSDSKSNSSKYQYIKVTLYGRNVYYAESKATKYAQLIVGILSFTKMLRVETFTFIGIPKPLIELELRCVFAFKDGEYLDSASFKDDRPCNTFYKIEQHNIKKFTTVMSAFHETKDDKIKEIICDSMSCFYEGLIERNVKYSFLNFWKVIEILSLKDKEEAHHKIVSRLKAMFTLSDIDSYSIDKIYELRNELVHNANNVNITTVDRNKLKALAEIYISFFLFKLSKLSYSDIKMQYPYFEYDENYLEKSKKAIDSVIKLKQKRTE